MWGSEQAGQVPRWLRGPWAGARAMLHSGKMQGDSASSFLCLPCRRHQLSESGLGRKLTKCNTATLGTAAWTSAVAMPDSVMPSCSLPRRVHTVCPSRSRAEVTELSPAHTSSQEWRGNPKPIEGRGKGVILTVGHSAAEVMKGKKNRADLHDPIRNSGTAETCLPRGHL